MPSVCVVGMGYVGWPLAELCARQGYIVYARETDPKKIAQLQEERPDFHLNTSEGLKADVVVIAVPTPIDDKKVPDLTFVRAVSEEVAASLDDSGRLIVLESTVNPFVSRKVVLPILEKNGLKCGKDFFLAHCPERIDPGNPKWDVSNIPRVVGAISVAGLEKAETFYGGIISGEVLALQSIEAAEMVKVYENSFRAVNIAFANEMAIVMQNLRLDVREVINGVRTKPFGLDLCTPGPGVGGHCIAVDPFYLIDESQKRGFDPSFLRTAMRVNGYMPAYTVSLLTHALNEVGKSVNGSRIGVLGVSYKKNVGDLRGSPALDIVERLTRLGGDVKVHDPHVAEKNTASAEEVLRCDAVLLLTNHDAFHALDFSQVPVVIDGHNVLDEKKLSGVYKGIGR